MSAGSQEVTIHEDDHVLVRPPYLPEETRTFTQNPDGIRSWDDETGSTHAEDVQFDVGIFNHHLDQGVNRRVKPIIESLGYRVGTFDSYNHPAGGAYQAKCVDFVQECHSIFWVASSNSIHDRGYIKFYREMSQNKAIKCGRCNTFITLLPRDSLNLDLPWELDTFVPLKENDQFEEQVKCTLDKILGESGFPYHRFHIALHSNVVKEVHIKLVIPMLM
ncbi:uncharacterized protein LOC143446397 [Clavelina lepadiformis]|uniref:uncharacterized protein LOC143446397 n=1 Tax=Clavelina lepadiformis TaxID=159417 RepID=UPI004042F54E